MRGTGLGHRFLSHLERTKVLVHLVDVSSSSGRDPVEDYEIITRELELFPGRDAVGRAALGEASRRRGEQDRRARRSGAPGRACRRTSIRSAIPLFKVSAATGEGVDRAPGSRLAARLPPRATRATAVDDPPSDRT